MGSSATRDKIVEIGEDLLQKRGFNAFSYQDIADQLGIRKASVHYHFASKSDLGTALAERNANWALQTLTHIDSLQMTAWQQLDAFLKPFVAQIATCERMSSGAMLASELETLPQTVQERNFEYYLILHTWLTRVLNMGRNHGEMYFATDPSIKADGVIAALEGAAILAKTRRNTDFLEPLIADLKSGLGA